MYSNLDIPATLDFFYERYVQQIQDFRKISAETVISDIGAGYGWLAIAFAFNTEARIIAIEPNQPRLKAGRKIAEILGVADKIDWRTGSLGDLPLIDRESDISYCIEVLEHVKKNPDTLKDLCRITREFIVLTTPNLWFPIIAHDTQLPFCHWLTLPLRKKYAELFNRTDKENDNLFWSPSTLKKGMPDFVRVSPWLHYASYDKYLATFPFYLPYGQGKTINKPGALKKIYYGMIAKLGIYSHIFTPNLAGVFRRVN
jgi:SAM-dependent methyltransferase